MASTKEQIKDLDDLCHLYIKSNPNFNQKDGQPAKQSGKGSAA